MNRIFCLVLSVLLLSCSASEEVTISNKPEIVTEKSLIITPSKPLKTTNYPFNFLLIAVPSTYKLESNGWTLVAPNGDKIRVAAVLTASNGKKTSFEDVAFMYGDKKQYLALDSDEKLEDEYVKVQVTTSKAFMANEVVWFSTAKY